MEPERHQGQPIRLASSSFTLCEVALPGVDCQEAKVRETLSSPTSGEPALPATLCYCINVPEKK